MKQTAVEWLVEQILTQVQNYEDGDIENEWEEPFKHEYVNKYIGMIDLSEFVIKAIEMEKEQILEAFFYGTENAYEVPVEGVDDAEFYYNDKFKK